MDISASGLSAQRIRMNVIAANIANVQTTRTPQGGPYRRKEVVFANVLGDVEAEGRGVKVTGIFPDSSPFKSIYNPGHPDANSQGYVKIPNIDIVTEMIDMISATRSYEANVTAFKSAQGMILKALEIISR